MGSISMYSHRHFCFDKADFSTKRPNFTMPFYYVKVPKSKNELTHVHVGQKHPFTQKIRSLAQKRSILTQNGVCKNRCAYDCRNGSRGREPGHPGVQFQSESTVS